MTITCEGCGAELEHWNAQKKEWYLVSTGRPHTIDNCPGKERLIEALKARRGNTSMTDKNVEKYASQLMVCKKCGARYSHKLEKCPQCKDNFIKSLFKEPIGR